MEKRTSQQQLEEAKRRYQEARELGPEFCSPAGRARGCDCRQCRIGREFRNWLLELDDEVLELETVASA